MNEPNPPTPTNWQEYLVLGNADEALKQLGNADDVTFESLKMLTFMAEDLREKAWAKALRRVQGLKIDSLKDSALILDWDKLKSDLALLQKAGESLEQRKPEDALETLQLINSPLLDAEKQTLLGTVYIYTNDTKAAKTAFEQALKNDSKHYRAMTNLGNLELEAGNYDQAIVAYEKALKLNDTFANAFHNLGVAYRKKGQISKSIKHLRKAQDAGQKKLREEARESLRGMGGLQNNPQLKKLLKWGAYALVAVVIYVILRSRGLL